MKTSELTGAALDWAVAKCEGYTDLHKIEARLPHEPQLAMMPPRKAYGAVELWELGFSTDWSQGGPIIEREQLNVRYSDGQWVAEWWVDNSGMAKKPAQRFRHNRFVAGPTALIAAMRCFVASRLGDEVNIPEELQ